MPRAAQAPTASAPDAIPPWYVIEGQRGQGLLEQGLVPQATEVFESLLARLGAAPSFGKAVVLERLGHCVQASGRLELAIAHWRDAIAVTGRLPPTDGVKALRCTLRSELGDAFRAAGLFTDARKAYEAALKISKEVGDLRSQGVELGRLGGLALADGKLDEALSHYQAALRLFRQLSEPGSEAIACRQIGRVLQEQGQWDLAERHYREALAAAQKADPAGAEAWRMFGALAELSEQQAAAAQDTQRRDALQGQARNYRELERRAPLIVAAATRLRGAPSFGRAAILGRLGRCFCLAGRPDLGLAHLREALDVVGRLSPGDGRAGIQAMLLTDLGGALRTLGNDREAAEADEEAGEIVRVLRGSSESSVPGISLREDAATEYAFEPDLLIDGPRTEKIVRWTAELAPLADELRPLLVPGTRTWLDESGAVRFRPPRGEPIVERDLDCTVIRRTQRELVISGSSSLIWQLIRDLDGSSTIGEITSRYPAGDRPEARRILSALAAAGVMDVSGRPLRRFLHWATKKGVLPAGGLEREDVLRLAGDGSYRSYLGVPRISVGDAVPERLRSFHALTRARRSSRDFQGSSLRQEEFDAILHTGCGVTGAMALAGREVKLRAYPSSGALYAVEIYPVVFRVQRLEPAVYHYDPVESVLEVVRPSFDRDGLIAAALPMERDMVAAVAAMFCLTGRFSRHERKYGEGGYRMLVAEAGHISQNLVLTATALGLSARPFGGVFDDLLNQALGLDGAEEQFLLAVVVGRTGHGQDA